MFAFTASNCTPDARVLTHSIIQTCVSNSQHNSVSLTRVQTYIKLTLQQRHVEALMAEPLRELPSVLGLALVQTDIVVLFCWGHHFLFKNVLLLLQLVQLLLS